VSKALGKCRRCSSPIEAHELIIELRGDDVIHIRCWLVGETEERVRASQQQIRRSQAHIDDSRRRLRDLPEADPDGSDDSDDVTSR
jgi:hypothetical protein